MKGALTGPKKRTTGRQPARKRMAMRFKLEDSLLMRKGKDVKLSSTCDTRSIPYKTRKTSISGNC